MFFTVLFVTSETLATSSNKEADLLSVTIVGINDPPNSFNLSCKFAIVSIASSGKLEPPANSLILDPTLPNAGNPSPKPKEYKASVPAASRPFLKAFSGLKDLPSTKSSAVSPRNLPPPVANAEAPTPPANPPTKEPTGGKKGAPKAAPLATAGPTTAKAGAISPITGRMSAHVEGSSSAENSKLSGVYKLFAMSKGAGQFFSSNILIISAVVAFSGISVNVVPSGKSKFLLILTS